MPETIVKLQDVAVFQNENLVLKDVNLEVKKGEFVYVIGKTGSGKSSLMKTLYADIPLKQGDAIYEGNWASSSRILNYCQTETSTTISGLCSRPLDGPMIPK